MKHCIQTLGLLAIVSSFAFAQDAPKKEQKKRNPEAMFKKLDGDSNGSLSLEEFKTSFKAKKKEKRATKVFGKMDADSSGSVTMDEFKAHRPGKGKGGKGKGKGKRGGGEKAPATPEDAVAE